MARLGSARSFGAKLFLGAILNGALSHAADVEMEFVAQWPELRDPVTALAVQDSYAYLAAGRSGLVVVDVSDPAAPRVVGQAVLDPGNSGAPGLVASTVAIEGDTAYVGGELGVHIFSIQDPLRPHRIGRFSLFEPVHLSARYPWLFISGGTGLTILDVSDRRSPRLVRAVPIGLFPGRLAVRGDYAYVLEGSAGLQILNVADPANVSRVGGLPFLYGRDVALQDNFAFVTVATDGLRVIDVADPANPQMVTLLGGAPFSSLRYLAITAQTLYATDTPSVSHVIDISNPRQPRRTGGLAHAGGGVILTQGERAYSFGAAWTGGEQFDIMDVEDPLRPRVIGSYRSPTISIFDLVATQSHILFINGNYDLEMLDVSDFCDWKPAGIFDFVPQARVLCQDGNFLYVGFWNTNQLSVLDISQPASPRLLATYETPGPVTDLALAPPYLYAGELGVGLEILEMNNPRNLARVGLFVTAHNPELVAVAGGKALVTLPSHGVDVIDVRVPANPQHERLIPTANYVRALALIGDAALIGSYGILRIININNPSQETAFGDGPYQIGLRGNTAYLLRGALEVVDFTVPFVPVRLGKFPLPREPRELFLFGPYAYIAQENYGRPYFTVLDVNLLANPQRRWQRSWSPAYNFAVEGNRGFLAQDTNGLRVVKLEDPENPETVQTYQPANRRYWDLAVTNFHAYVAAGNNGMEILTVAGDVPTPVAAYDTAGDARRVLLADEHAFIADGSNGLEIINISNRAQPTRVGGLRLGGFAQDIALLNHYAFVALGVNGFKTVDISNLSGPREVGWTLTLREAISASAQGTWACIRDNTSGFLLYDVSNAARPVLVGRYPVAYGGEGHSAFHAKYLYVCSWEGLGILDLSDPANLRRIGGVSASAAWQITFAADILYVASPAEGLVALHPFLESGTRRLSLGVARDQILGTASLSASGVSGIELAIQRSPDYLNWTDAVSIRLTNPPSARIQVPTGEQKEFFRAIAK